MVAMLLVSVLDFAGGDCRGGIACQICSSCRQRVDLRTFMLMMPHVTVVVIVVIVMTPKGIGAEEDSTRVETASFDPDVIAIVRVVRLVAGASYVERSHA